MYVSMDLPFITEMPKTAYFVMITTIITSLPKFQQHWPLNHLMKRLPVLTHPTISLTDIASWPCVQVKVMAVQMDQNLHMTISSVNDTLLPRKQCICNRASPRVHPILQAAAKEGLVDEIG
jgi:hypothetical protein